MITRDQVIEMARQYGFVNTWIDEKLNRFAHAAYKRGVEDAINKTVELGAIDRDGVFADEIRTLLENSNGTE